MDRTERFYKVEEMLQCGRSVPMKAFLDAFGVSKATFRRDLDYPRDRLRMPILWDRQQRGYRLDLSKPYRELPGLWFSSAEVHALLTFYHLLERVQPGLLAPHIEPLRTRIRALLEKGDHSFEEVARRIRVLPLAARTAGLRSFETIAHALLKRRRLIVTHYSRPRSEQTEREVSPQRLVHYRDNWYLDAWDPHKNALRTFAVDAIRRAAVLDNKARNVPDRTLDAELGAGYGIFTGRKTKKARLRFTPQRARWVANEQWHPNQKGYYDGEHYVLEVPYSDERELMMDILKCGPDAEVLAPASLRQQIADRLRSAAGLYASSAQSKPIEPMRPSRPATVSGSGEPK